MKISEDTSSRILELHERTTLAVDSAVDLIGNPSHVNALNLLSGKKKISDRVEDMRAYLARRLAAEEPNRVETYRLETNFIEYINRIHILALRITQTVVELADDRPAAGHH